MAVVSITFFKVNALRHVPKFLRLSGAAKKAAERAKGVKAVKLTAKFYLRFFTITQWESLDDLMAYVRSDAHAEAMKHSNKFGKGMVYHFESDELPSWSEACRLVVAHGRRVN